MYRKNPLPWIFVVVGVVLIATGMLWARFNQPIAAEATVTPVNESQVQRATLEDAKVAYDSKSAVFLDVRDSSTYATAHIPGAINIPLAELPTRMGELDPKAWIISYCT